MNEKFIHDITPFSVVDFPDEISAIVWFCGCNMRCAYCYNPEVVLGIGQYSLNDLASFLRAREGLLSAIVLSGGECTKSPIFVDVLESCKKYGFKTKVDTNGSNPFIIKQNLEKIDFISLDFKATKNKFINITKSDFYDEFLLTLSILNHSNIKFEVRTTVHTDLLSENDINEMIDVLKQNGYKGKYHLQNFDNKLNLGDIHKQIRLLDPNLLDKSLEISLRNFK